MAAFLLGVFVDADHLFDYFAYFGWHFNLVDFFHAGNYMEEAEKVYVLLHGWEFIIPLWLIGRWLGKKAKIKGLEWAVVLAYLAHLLWDNLSFNHHPLAYSFVYRLLHHFSPNIFKITS